MPDTARRLNEHLQKLFGISESIYAAHYKKERGYRTRFKVFGGTYHNAD
jgi:hypothetical protein